MANHAVGASSTNAFTQNSYQNITATISDGSSLTGTLSAGDSFTLANNGSTVLALYITTSGTGTIDAIASANDVAMTFTATATYVIGPLDPTVFGTSVTISTTTAAGKYETFAVNECVAGGQPPPFGALHNPFEATATNPDY
jgi:streptogramin lyase